MIGQVHIMSRDLSQHQPGTPRPIHMSEVRSKSEPHGMGFCEGSLVAQPRHEQWHWLDIGLMVPASPLLMVSLLFGE